jgi:hypothetical protein
MVRSPSAGECLRGGLLLLLCASSCGGDDDDAHEDTSSADETAAAASTAPDSTAPDGTTADGTAAGTTDGPDSTTSTTSSASTTAPTTTAATNGPTEPCPPFGDETGSNALTGDMGFSFSSTPYCDYEQIDRIGIPLVIDLLIDSKGAYRTSSPAENQGLFYAEIGSSIIALRNRLVTAIANGGWLACSTLDSQCQQQATELVAPDLLYLASVGAEGFRDGRKLDTPMPDRVLAQLLLDLDIHDVEAFADDPLNPPENDVPFSEAWPYLAEPH